MTLDNMTGITEGSYTGFCKSQLITCNFVKSCNGVCPFEDALKHADKMQTMNEQHTVDHDRDWIIGCIKHDGFIKTDRFDKANQIILDALSAEAETDGDMGEVSDGYHTFNQLYHQRAVLFATIVKQNKEKAWKSWKHGDGKFCFDSNKEWFIVGVDTPEGSYTYHYEKKYWDMFDCIELEHCKFWDGHTEEDVTRLLSIPSAEAVQGWIPCSERLPDPPSFCLVTTDGSHNDVIDIALYMSDGWHKASEIVAWMPLPTPYKGGDDE